MPDYSRLGEKAEAILEGIARAAENAGRRGQDVTLMAVTKFHPLEAARAAYEAGIRVFGESRVQEAEAKFSSREADFPGLRLDLIGNLQTNKAKRAASLFSTIQSVDSLGLIAELDKRARAAGQALDILLELHTGEESKAGFPDLDGLFAACDLLGRLGLAEPGRPGLRLRGLMTMAPFTEDPGPIRASFRTLAKAQRELSSRYPSLSLDTLSMGMSNDYLLAVEEGSTLVRIGTGLFGPRPGPAFPA
jgi:pyridoxal phosphate enzyme (YggS family)